MVKVNEHYLELPGNYLFSVVAERVRSFQEDHPEAKIIRLGIGDVTLPLVPAVIEALHQAVSEMGNEETFRGYAPDRGYAFLRETIAECDYRRRGCSISPEEIFISDGAKCDCGNIQEIFSIRNRIAVCDPVYPVYVDSNAMAGRTGRYDPAAGKWSDVIYMPCTEGTGFLPELPGKIPDLIYLCFPNNPTGAAMPKERLQEWVDYAIQNGSVILYDAAYEAYIREEGIPHSIYECRGAKTCAIEMRSFSKTAGFTGLRLGYTVVPEELKIGGVKAADLWARRHGTKYNGAPYIVQRAGEAVYSSPGREQVKKQIRYYMDNASLIRQGLSEAGYEVFGGVNAPYIWLKAPRGMNGTAFFEQLLQEAHVVGTPGSGFGPSGELFLRLTAFGNREKTREAVERIRNL